MRSPGSLLPRVLLAAALAVLSVVAPAFVDAASIGLYADVDGSSCAFQEPPLFGTASVYIIVKGTAGSTAAQFVVSSPPCAYELASWEAIPGLSVGDPESGIGIAFGGCVSGDFAIMRLDYTRIADPTSNCCALRLLPHPDTFTGSVELVDCSSPTPNITPAITSAIWLIGDDSCAPVPPPSNPFPFDGMTDGPINVMLDAELHGAEYLSACVPLGSDWIGLYFGTNPDPPLVGTVGALPHSVVAVTPATTYYWKLVYQAYGVAPSTVSSPVWSFTTTNITPVSPSTWGKIKSLYR